MKNDYGKIKPILIVQFCLTMLGTVLAVAYTTERIVFLGLLIKNLVDEQVYLTNATWKVVCDDSANLGHYWNLKK